MANNQYINNTCNTYAMNQHALQAKCLREPKSNRKANPCLYKRYKKFSLSYKRIHRIDKKDNRLSNLYASYNR